MFSGLNRAEKVHFNPERGTNLDSEGLYYIQGGLDIFGAEIAFVLGRNQWQSRFCPYIAFKQKREFSCLKSIEGS